MSWDGPRLWISGFFSMCQSFLLMCQTLPSMCPSCTVNASPLLSMLPSVNESVRWYNAIFISGIIGIAILISGVVFLWACPSYWCIQPSYQFVCTTLMICLLLFLYTSFCQRVLLLIVLYINRPNDFNIDSWYCVSMRPPVLLMHP